MKRARLLAAGLFAALTVSCDGPGGTLVSCSGDSDCSGGQVCYLDGCGSPMSFAVRVTPNSSAYFVQDFNPVSPTMSWIDLTLSDPGTVQGDLQLDTAKGVVPYLDGFTIQATGSSSVIPGLPFSQQVAQTVSVGSSRFSFSLPPGDWQFRATPKPPAPLPSRESPPTALIPPVQSRWTIASGQVVDPMPVLPGQGLTELQGQLIRAPGVPWPSNELAYFRFQALDPATLAPLSQPATFLTSSTFHVFTAARTGQVLLRVSPDPLLNSDAVLPIKDFIIDAAGGAPSSFEMGSWGSTITVTGKVAERAASSTSDKPAAGDPIANADVRAEGILDGGGRLIASVKTDSKGKFSLRLLPSPKGAVPPAQYTLTISPPFGSSFGSTTLSLAVNVVPNNELSIDEPILCPPKISLRGRVLGAGVVPLSGVPVLLDGDPASANPGPSSVHDLVTGPDGTWAAEVEPGDYQLVAAPASTYPWSAQPVTASQSAVVPDIVLAQGRGVMGSLTHLEQDGSRTVVTGATVSIFRLPTSPGLPPLKIYEALSDQTGSFRVVLPRDPDPTAPPPDS